MCEARSNWHPASLPGRSSLIATLTQVVSDRVPSGKKTDVPVCVWGAGGGGGGRGGRSVTCLSGW